MATVLTDSFLQELLGGIHDFDTDEFRIALYTASASLGTATTVYSTTNELPEGNGYSRGAKILTGAAIGINAHKAYVDFNNPVWANASFTAGNANQPQYALIYNASKGNKAVSVHDFGSAQTVNAADFTVTIPSATANPTAHGAIEITGT
jgi:hypothetical protein